MGIIRGRVAVTVAVIIVDHVFRSSHTTSTIHRSMGDMCRFWIHSYWLSISSVIKSKHNHQCAHSLVHSPPIKFRAEYAGKHRHTIETLHNYVFDDFVWRADAKKKKTGKRNFADQSDVPPPSRSTTTAVAVAATLLLVRCGYCT